MIKQLTKTFEHISQFIPGFYKLLNPYYSHMTKQEVKLAGITKRDHVLIIGAGPLPLTAYNIHHLTSAKITLLDNDKHCIKPAKRFVHKHNLNNAIFVECKDGLDVDIDGYSVVFVANQVCPKHDVLDALLKQAKPSTRIIVRTNQHDAVNIEPYHFVHHKRKATHKTCLYVT